MSDQDEVFKAGLTLKLNEIRAQIQKFKNQEAAILELLGEDSGFEPAPGITGGPTPSNGKLESDTFHNKSVPDAIVKYLEIVGKPARPVTDIVAQLKAGGIDGSGKNFYSSVYTSLSRLKAKGLVDKTKSGDWGLKKWYS